MSYIDIKIEHALVITIDSQDTILYDGAVCIHNGMIVAIGTTEECKEYDAETIIDAQGNILMPGLINAHTHAGMSIFKGMADDLPLQSWLQDKIFPAEANYCTRENMEIATKLSIIEMIQSGTTCFGDMYYFSDVVADVCDRLHMRAVIAQAVIDFSAPDYKTPTDTLEALEKAIPVINKHPRITLIPGPHSPYTCSADIMQKCRALANKHALPLHIHVSETQQEYNTSLETFGKTPVETLHDLGMFSGKTIAAHCVYISEHDREIFTKHAVGVVNNAQSNLKLVSGVAPVHLMKEVGIPVALGTDSVVSNNSLDMFTEMKVAALIHKLNSANAAALPAKEIVRMATIDGARVLGIDQHVGSLEVGKQADMILININQAHLVPLYDVYSHLVYAVKGSDVDTVFIDGTCVYQNKHMLVTDVLECMIAAQTIANTIQQNQS